MQRQMATILESKWLWLLARLLVIVVFASSGLAKLTDFNGGVLEMRRVGLEPAWLFNLVVALGLLGGSMLILFDRALWLGAAGLAMFLLLTILVVHRFWALPEPQAMLSMFFALEHVSVIGGLIAMAIASHWRREWVHALEQWNGVKR